MNARRRKWMWVALIFAAGISIVCLWAPGAVKDYLNRPDTRLRQRMSDALSAKLGEPVSVAFQIADVNLTPAMHVVIRFSEIRISSPTLDRIGTEIQNVLVDVSLGKSLARRKAVLEQVSLRIPALTYAKASDGSWPHEKMKTEGTSSQSPVTGGDTKLHEAPLDIVCVAVEVGKAMIMPSADVTAELKDLSLVLDIPKGRLAVKSKNLRLSGLPTFSGLAAALNSIAGAVEGTILGPVSTAEKWAGRLTNLINRTKQTSREAVSAKGATEFDEASVQLQFAPNEITLEQSEFSNLEMTLSAGGTVSMPQGALDMTARVRFKEAGLKQFSSSITREIFSDEIVLPVRGTIMEPKFEKNGVLKAVGRRALKQLGIRR